MEGEANTTPKRQPVRVYVDGCFDMVHFGHANAIRQARELGDYLVVGVHNDADITRFKGPPVYSEEERYELVKAIKWADEVYVNAPYFYTVDLLDKLKCDFVAHGDDVSVSAETGEDVYKTQKESGRYKEFKRTTGVSTTDLVGRMLRMTRDHHTVAEEHDKATASSIALDKNMNSPFTGNKQFLSTSRRIAQFSSCKDPKPGDTVVYVSGAFDLMHMGQVKFLQKAKEEGDFLIVGLHTDQVVNQQKGDNFPIMNLQERVLCILSCKFVDEVVIGAPYEVTTQLLDHFGVNVVCHGQTALLPTITGEDPYMVARERGIFKQIHSGSDVTTKRVVERIVANRLAFERRNAKKEGKEIEHIEAEKRNAVPS